MSHFGDDLTQESTPECQKYQHHFDIQNGDSDGMDMDGEQGFNHHELQPENRAYEMIENTGLRVKTTKLKTEKKPKTHKKDQIEGLFRNQLVINTKFESAHMPVQEFKKTKEYQLLRDLHNNFELLEYKKSEDEEGNMHETNKYDFEPPTI